jgi:hypothetical protein
LKDFKIEVEDDFDKEEEKAKSGNFAYSTEDLKK